MMSCFSGRPFVVATSSSIEFHIFLFSAPLSVEGRPLDGLGLKAGLAKGVGCAVPIIVERGGEERDR